MVDSRSAAQIDQLSRALQKASGDVVVVATAPTIEPYGDIREYAVKLFQNNGRGIGEKGKDNGLLILLAVKERKVWIEVGYGLEELITDGFAGETSRQYMVPQFRNGGYGARAACRHGAHRQPDCRRTSGHARRREQAAREQSAAVVRRGPSSRS